MKLYRGLKSKEYLEFDEKLEKSIKSAWSEILDFREKGDFNYRENLNDLILELEKVHNLTHQNFTDNEKVAKNYAKREGGLLVSIDVPKEDILKFFKMEFQNFSKRRKKFEIVYVVDSKILNKYSKIWKLALQTC